MRDWLGPMRVGTLPYSVSKPLSSKFRVRLFSVTTPHNLFRRTVRNVGLYLQSEPYVRSQ